MKKILLVVASLVLLVATTFTLVRALSTPAGATSPTYNIGIKGVPLAGAVKDSSEEPAIFLFTITNNSSTTYAPAHGTYYVTIFLTPEATLTTMECVQYGWTTAAINSGGGQANVCNLLGLTPHASTQVPVDVYAAGDNPPSDTLTVTACTGPVPNSTAHCGSVSLPLLD